jgi:hypothetical protein
LRAISASFAFSSGFCNCSWIRKNSAGITEFLQIQLPFLPMLAQAALTLVLGSIAGSRRRPNSANAASIWAFSSSSRPTNSSWRASSRSTSSRGESGGAGMGEGPMIAVAFQGGETARAGVLIASGLPEGKSAAGEDAR